MSLEVTLDPAAHATLCREFTWELTWRPEQDYPAASQVELRSKQLRSFHLWRLTGASMTGADVTYRWKSNPSVSDMWRNANWVLLRAKLPYGAKRGKPCTIRLTCIPAFWADLPQHLSIWTIPPSNPMHADATEPLPTAEPASTCSLVAKAGPVERLCLYATPSARADGKVRLVISPQDRLGNPGTFQTPIEGRVEWEGNTQEVVISETTELQLPSSPEISRACLSLNLSALGRDENVANGSIDGAVVTVVSNPVWPIAGRNLSPVFGEFHWHTDHSGDGQRSVTEALRSAHDLLNLDYAMPSDHNPRGAAWSATVEAVEAAYKPGHFATIFGWEASTQIGHENLYFTNPDHPLVCGGSAGFSGGIPRETVEVIRQHDDVLVIPHHTNAVSESRRLEDDAPFWHPYDFSEPTPAHRLVEIFQTRGNQEANDYTDAQLGWHQHNGSSVQDALARGYRVGFTGGTDNHSGWPGRGYAQHEGANQHTPASQLMTGVWTPQLERQPLFDSLFARHTWAVWNTRAIVWFTINGKLMGDDLAVAAGTPLKAEILASAEAPWQYVELVSEGRVLWSEPFHELDIQATVDLGEAGRSTHVYLRALLRNGGLIYASPVFIDVETV